MAEQNGNHNEEPVVVKKGKKCGHGHHGGAWKVAYADFVTALMALFIVLWVLAQSEEVRTAVAHYFQNPTIIGISGSKTFMKGQGPGTGKIDVEQELKEELNKKDEEQKLLRRKGIEIIGALQSNPELAPILNQIEIKVTNDGLRIELLDNKSSFFESGSAKLKPKAKKILYLIGKQLSDLNNKIVVEGHTDAKPYPPNNRGYNNFDLSTDRANSARRILEQAGVDDKQIDEVRGYADHRLRDPEHPFSKINRRISILVKYEQLVDI